MKLWTQMRTCMIVALSTEPFPLLRPLSVQWQRNLKCVTNRSLVNISHQIRSVTKSCTKPVQPGHQSLIENMRKHVIIWANSRDTLPHTAFCSNAEHLGAAHTSFVYFHLACLSSYSVENCICNKFGTFCRVMMPEMGDSAFWSLSVTSVCACDSVSQTDILWQMEVAFGKTDSLLWVT